MKKSTTGISSVEVLQIVFIVLKLAKLITWKWVWVLSPTWIMIMLALVILIVYELVD